WTASVYQFFKPPALRFDADESDRPYTWFACNAPHCKASTGIRRYMDKSDATATKNLKRHAIKCFGEAVVEAVSSAKAAPADQSLHAAWAQQSSSKPAPKKPFTVATLRATLVRWFTESNRPMYAAKDRKFHEIVINGRPGIEVPSQTTIARDIKTSFELGEAHISKILNEYPGKLSFTNDAWTSPNHRAFVAWTVHLQHDGKPLSFLLDIFEVPTVCSSPHSPKYTLNRILRATAVKSLPRHSKKCLNAIKFSTRYVQFRPNSPLTALLMS
ncbi:hypothetical protein DFH09DRAFT_948816, partial [Mycena vulgaris]